MTSNPPYGYKKSLNGSPYWVVDEPAAEVIRRIYALCMDGKGPAQIARILAKDKIPTPNEYKRDNGGGQTSKLPAKPCNWQSSMVGVMLERPEYIGHTVNFRTYRKSFKLKKAMFNAPSEWKVFENTHEPIVKPAVWERVQEIRKGKRRPVKSGKVSLFSGIVYCADCDAKLYYRAVNGKSKNNQYFVCSRYSNDTDACTGHFIREITLFNAVLIHLQRVLAYVRQFEGVFVKAVNAKSTEEQKRLITEKRKMLTNYGKRITELDSLFQRLYEDSVSGKISEERFLKMSSTYEFEQATIKTEAAKLEIELTEEKQAAANTERFIALVKNYTEITVLSPTILHEFIDKIVIHAPDRSSGKRKQKVEIFYNSIGIIDVPSEDEMVEYFKRRRQRRLTEQAQQQVESA